MADSKGKDEEKPIVAKTAVDLQKLKLMKLMKNIDKPVVLPERPKSKSTPSVPEFVRNVMGSSAGAGSGEFHVYRHLRRKEYARQKFIQEKARKEFLDVEYHQKLEQNKRLAEEATAKKRAKRLKKKQNRKQMKRMKDTKEIKIVADSRQSEEDSCNSDENEETMTKTNENDKEDIQCCIKDPFTENDKTNTVTEKESSLLMDKNEEKDIYKASVEVSNENSQCENGT